MVPPVKNVIYINKKNNLKNSLNEYNLKLRIGIYKYMIFRKIDGSLLEIKKLDFKNDNLYYKKIIEFKFSKLKQLNNHYPYSQYLINSIVNI